ncbi:hypothetical protein ABC347_08330 [Sphingomonas sp. 1P06PA]|uniref:hypothetical protein n=1 Tax=Sphingomonas sp. 1P06PA TaxID=554121 RepID=UPI0039A495BE
MSTSDTNDIRRIATATVAALLLSATCVVAAVGPARAAEPRTTITVVKAPATGLVGAVRY